MVVIKIYPTFCYLLLRPPADRWWRGGILSSSKDFWQASSLELVSKGLAKMVLTSVTAELEHPDTPNGIRGHNTIDSMFASRYVQCELPKYASSIMSYSIQHRSCNIGLVISVAMC